MTNPVIDIAPVLSDTDQGDHDRFAHIVGKVKATESRVTGTPIRALCGKVWTPSRDASKYPVCPGCIDEWEKRTGRKFDRGGFGTG